MTTWKVGWGFTSKCNFNCEFCYSRLHRSKTNITHGDVKEALTFVDNNKHKIDAINYGTGENVIENKWWELFEGINEINPDIEQGITTNGSLFVEATKNEERIELIKKTLNDVDVSLDYGDRDKHNSGRGHPKAFEWATQTLDLCDELGIEKSIVMIANPKTFKLNNLKQIVGLTEKYDTNLRINIYRPVYRDSPKFLISPKEFYKGLSFLMKEMNILSMSDPLFSALIGEKKYKGDFTGRSSLRILEGGSVCPSTFLMTEEWRAANIFQNPNLDLDSLHDTEPFKRLLDSKIPKECKSCPFLDNCRGGAYDRRWLWYKTLEKPDPYCPFHPFQGGINLDKYFNEFEYGKDVKLVHDGYLPTIIFSNG